MLTLGAIFACTFVLGRVLGILTVENVRQWLEQAHQIDPLWLAGVVIFLLFIDLFIAVPTLSITLLAGYFLGFGLGAAAALTGVTAAAFTGYALSRQWGEKPISCLVKDPVQRQDMKDAFSRSGPVMIVLSRAAPMVPEVTSCMAGATGMGFFRFAGFFFASAVPYVAIAAYAGSISSAQSPQPAIFTAIALYAVLWTGWYFFQKRSRNSPNQLPGPGS